MTSDDAQNVATCANCATPLSGPYCFACGQARDSILRPFLSLFGDLLDAVFDLHGRLLTTVRDLFTRPGRVAREFVDGRRAAYTPPFRLYLLASLAFFTVVGVSGVRVIGVDTDLANFGFTRAGVAISAHPDGRLSGCEDVDDLPGVSIRLFTRGETPDPVTLSAAERACLDQIIENQNSIVNRFIFRVLVGAVEQPGELEATATRSAAQALIAMIFAFALLNAALHPRRRAIEHAVHAIYFHAAMLAPWGAYILAANMLGAISAAAPIVLATTGLIAFAVVLWLFDRGFYGSSILGASLRAVAMFIGYQVAMALIIFALMFAAVR